MAGEWFTGLNHCKRKTDCDPVNKLNLCKRYKYFRAENVVVVRDIVGKSGTETHVPANSQ